MRSVFMRKPVNKYRSAKKFKNQVKRVKATNVLRPGRGGYRL